MDQETEPGNDKLTRRLFLTTTGGLAVGLGVGQLTSVQPAYAAEALPPLPWGPHYYPKSGLSPTTVAELAYCLYYKEGGCGQGSGQALIDTLAATLALENPAVNPWALLPRGLYAYGSGGGVGWGTLCGALNGTLAVMDILGVHNQLGNALVDYFCNTELPTVNLVGYIPPAGIPAPLVSVTTSTSQSPLCHNSVSAWAKVAGVPISDPSKRDRCAKLVGDVVAYAAQLMNDRFLNGKVPAAWTAPTTYATCYTCHTGATMVPSQQGKMDCTECHTVNPSHSYWRRRTGQSLLK